MQSQIFRFTRVHTLLLVSLLINWPIRAAVPIINQILPFAGENQVRVKLSVTPVAGESILLIGKITESAANTLLWSGPLGEAQSHGLKNVIFEKTIDGLKPKLWTVAAPNLYDLEITAKQGEKTIDRQKTRFGFRTFQTKNAQFYLNGKPI